MVKYCIRCGEKNDDEASFCVGCGEKLTSQAATGQVQAASSITELQPSLFTAELGAGAHKHMLTDLYLKDQAGKVVLVARRESLLHRDYTVVDGAEKVVGYLEHKTHLTHATLSVQDAGHVAQNAVQVSNIRTGTQRYRKPPDCWIEDAGGNRSGSVVFTNGLYSFSVLRTDGSGIFNASSSGGAGLVQELSAMAHRAYTIGLIEKDCPLTLVLGTIAAIDSAASG